MEGLKLKPKTYTLMVTVLFTVLVSSVKGQIGQINMPCTSSMISGFTPCMDYITGSTADGSSPTPGCCDAFESLMRTSLDCGCMLVTGSLPLSLGYIKRNLALSLPRLCGTDDAPAKCQAAASPRPAPTAGRKQLGPPTPPSSAYSPHASKARNAAPTVDDDDDDEATAGQKPEAPPPVAVEAPSATSLTGPLARSPSNPSMISSQALWLLLMGFLVFKLL